MASDADVEAMMNRVIDAIGVIVKIAPSGRGKLLAEAHRLFDILDRHDLVGYEFDLTIQAATIYAYNKLHGRPFVKYSTSFEKDVANYLYDLDYRSVPIPPIYIVGERDVPREPVESKVSPDVIDRIIANLAQGSGTVCGMQLGGVLGQGNAIVYSTDSVQGTPSASMGASARMIPQAIKVQNENSIEAWRSFVREVAINKTISNLLGTHESGGPLTINRAGFNCPELGKQNKLVMRSNRANMDLLDYINSDTNSLLVATGSNAAAIKKMNFKIVSDLICQLYRLHSMRVFHGDIKPHNVGLTFTADTSRVSSTPPGASSSGVSDAPVVASLIDFGQSEPFESLYNGGTGYLHGGTMQYNDAGIECGGRKFGPETDVRALGLIISMLLLGVLIPGVDNREEMLRILFSDSAYEASLQSGDDLTDLERDLLNTERYDPKRAHRCLAAIRSVRRNMRPNTHHVGGDGKSPLTPSTPASKSDLVRSLADVVSPVSSATSRSGASLFSPGGETRADAKEIQPTYYQMAPQMQRYMNGTLYTKEQYAAIIQAVQGMTRIDPRKRWTMEDVIRSPLYSILTQGNPRTACPAIKMVPVDEYKASHPDSAVDILADNYVNRMGELVEQKQLTLNHSERDMSLVVLRRMAENVMRSPRSSAPGYTADHVALEKKLTQALGFDLLSGLYRRQSPPSPPLFYPTVTSPPLLPSRSTARASSFAPGPAS